MTDPLAYLATDPELAAEAAAARAEWRAEEEEWTRAEAERWVHRRTLVDLAREYLHRGDEVAVVAAGVTFCGELTRVGTDWLQVQTMSGRVDVALTLNLADGPAGAQPAPVLIRRTERARAGGRRDDGAVATFRARLLEHETNGAVVVVGSRLLPGELRGVLAVGADHVLVCAEGVETAVPWVEWVRCDAEAWG
ncbi:MAG: hypothetical protein ACRDWD_06005 [Acidimicrobiia bacterium]